MTGIAICGFNWFKDGTLHKDLDTWFLKGIELGYKRFMLMLPRAHLKTTYIIAYMVNQILNDQETRILYRMSSASNAEKTLSSVIEILSPSNAVLGTLLPRVCAEPQGP